MHVIPIKCAEVYGLNVILVFDFLYLPQNCYNGIFEKKLLKNACLDFADGEI